MTEIEEIAEKIRDERGKVSIRKLTFEWIKAIIKESLERTRSHRKKLTLQEQLFEHWQVTVKLYSHIDLGTISRSILLFIVMMSLGCLTYVYLPGWWWTGWTNLVFGQGGNILLIPLTFINFMSKEFAFLWLGLIWVLLGLFFPKMNYLEEMEFRKGFTSWKEISMQSIKFGMLHLLMGIPLMAGPLMSIPGLAWGWRYKTSYLHCLEIGLDSEEAENRAVFDSTADHLCYNMFVVTVGVVLLAT